MLTDREIKHAQPRDRKYTLFDSEGLFIEIPPTGNKRWRIKYRFGDKEYRLSLGTYPKVPLTVARQQRIQILASLAQGKNPSVERKVAKVLKTQRSSQTFKEFAEKLIEIKRERVTSESIKRYQGYLNNYIYPKIGALPIADISPPLLVATLRPIEAKGRLETLSKARALIGEVFEFAKAHGAFVGDNPAHPLRRNVFKTRPNEHFEALPFDKIGEFLRNLDFDGGEPTTRIAVLLAIHSGARPSETCGAKWAEIDAEKKLWTIGLRKGRKSRKEHVVPLATQTLDLLTRLRQLTGDSEYLFPSRPGAKTPHLDTATLLKAIRRTSKSDTVTSHGFRSVIRTQAGESGRWSFEVLEALLSHGKRDQVVAAYSREQFIAARREIAEWWCSLLDQKKQGAQIVQMTRQAA